MKQLNKKELKQITGGGISWGAILGIGAGLTFLVGLIDGLNRLK